MNRHHAWMALAYALMAVGAAGILLATDSNWIRAIGAGVACGLSFLCGARTEAVVRVYDNKEQRGS